MFAKYLSTLALLVVAQLASIANAETVVVPDWIVPYRGETEWQASVGDTIEFQWPANGLHNVFIHPLGGCNRNNAALVGAQPGSSYTFTEADGSADGTLMTFACDIGGGSHCRFGQIITVMVYSGAAPGGAGVVPDVPITESPTTAPTPPPTDAPVAAPEPEEKEEPVSELGELDMLSGASFNSFSVASVVGLVGAVVALAL